LMEFDLVIWSSAPIMLLVSITVVCL